MSVQFQTFRVFRIIVHDLFTFCIILASCHHVSPCAHPLVGMDLMNLPILWLVSWPPWSPIGSCTTPACVHPAPCSRGIGGPNGGTGVGRSCWLRGMLHATECSILERRSCYQHVFKHEFDGVFPTSSQQPQMMVCVSVTNLDREPHNCSTHRNQLHLCAAEWTTFILTGLTIRALLKDKEASG